MNSCLIIYPAHICTVFLLIFSPDFFFPCCPLWFYSSTKVIISILISAPEPWCFFKINLNVLANSRTCSVTCTFHSFWCGYLNLQDLPFRPKYLVTFTVGIAQKDNINRAVKKVTFRDYLHLTLLLHPKFYCLVGTAAVFFVLTTSNSFVNIHISSWSNNFGKLPDFFFPLVAVAVFKGFCNPVVSLWWPGDWMGWISVVKASYPCKRPETSKMVCALILYYSLHVSILKVVVVLKVLWLSWPLGGMLKDSCTLISWQPMSMYLSGMRTLELIILTERSM